MRTLVTLTIAILALMAIVYSPQADACGIPTFTYSQEEVMEVPDINADALIFNEGFTNEYTAEAEPKVAYARNDGSFRVGFDGAPVGKYTIFRQNTDGSISVYAYLVITKP